MLTKSGVDTSHDHRPRRLARDFEPEQVVLVLDRPATAVVSPDPAATRSTSIMLARNALAKAVKDAYRDVLQTRINDKPALGKIGSPHGGAARLAVSPDLVKATAIAAPTRNEVVALAADKLLTLSKGDGRVRQGLAIMKVSTRDLAEIYDRLRLTPEQVLAGF
jgi:hypothetical protein